MADAESSMNVDTGPVITDDGLCGKCRKLNLGQAFLYGWAGIGSYFGEVDHPAFTSLAALDQSSTTCECCRFIFSIARKHLRQLYSTLDSSGVERAVRQCRLTRLMVELYSRVEESAQCHLIFAVKGPPRPNGDEEIEVIHLCMGLSKDANLTPKWAAQDRAWNINLSTVPEMPTLDGLWDFITPQINLCEMEHPICKSQWPRGALPKRLLKVNEGDRRCLRLCESVKESDRYVALSYCWGSDVGLKTTSHNLEDFTDAVNEDTLPRTYLDAIALTRKIGISHIWIDAFCIVQDDADDWQRESAKMESIYSGAYLTICASNAASVSEGFLKSRLPAVARCGTANVDGVAHAIYVSQAADCLRPDDPVLRDEPLSQRGWALQERILSRRTLHFTSTQVFWECNTVGLLETGIFEWSSAKKETVEGNQHRALVNVEGLGAYYIWNELVERFTACTITKASDRLPAISGLAKRYSTAFNDTYVASHWENTLLDYLFWRALSPQGTSAASYRAPSWSWASQGGPIRFETMEPLLAEGFARDAVELISVKLTLKGSNEGGEVIDGYMDVSAACLPVEIDLITPDDGRPDGPVLTMKHRDQRYPLVDALDYSNGVLLDHDQGTNGCFALIMTAWRHLGQTNPSAILNGLLLKRTEDHGVYRYHRAGYFIDLRTSRGDDIANIPREIVRII